MVGKKSFKVGLEQYSPAATYISPMAAEDEKERKSKRLNLLIRPSVYEQVEKIATMQRKSVNELINIVLEAYAADHAAEVARYEEVFGEGR